MQSEMSNEVYIITGGARRIGYALTRFFSEQAKRVIISYRSEYPELAELRERGVCCLYADFSTDRGINEFAEQVSQQLKEWGNASIRALVHNASSWEKDGNDVVTLSHALDAMMQIHVKAPYLLNHLLNKSFAPKADIIHFTDYVVEKGSDKHIAYAASKAALENMTLSFAKKLAPAVKVNAIAPALIMFNPQDSDEYKQKALDKSVMQCAPGEQEIIEAVSYLLSSRYVTGRTLHVDGGRHIR